MLSNMNCYLRPVFRSIAIIPELKILPHSAPLSVFSTHPTSVLLSSLKEIKEAGLPRASIVVSKANPIQTPPETNHAISIVSLSLTTPVTCLDPRCIPENFFDLQTGKVAVIRNVAGHVRPVLNDLITIDFLASITDILLVHHTG